MVWQEPRDYVTECYFCMVNTKGLGKKIGIKSPIHTFPHDSLHIQLGLMKQFVKTLNSDDECFQHIVSAFSKLSFVVRLLQHQGLLWQCQACLLSDGIFERPNGVTTLF